MNILWHSNAPWAPSGYGVQTKLFCPRLRDAGHNVSISAFYGLEGAAIHWDGIPVLPRAAHHYGQDILNAHAQWTKADIVLSLIDIWVYDPRQWPNVRWCPWFPIDSEPFPPPVLLRAREAYLPLVYSRFAEEQCKIQNLDCRYIPHGVDTSALNPMDKAEARAKLGWPQDKYIYGMVAANKDWPTRKAFQSHLDAFSMVLKQHPDSLLYMHTFHGAEQGGMNIAEYAKVVGVDQNLTYNNQYQTLIGLGDDYMKLVYNAMDCLLSVSMGEGFGVPILEAQACGTPVILGDWTSMGELCFPGSWKVAKDQAMPFWDRIGAYKWWPMAGGIAEKMQEARVKTWTETERRTLAAHARDYDVDAVFGKFWKPVLAELEERINIGAGELKLVNFS